jgi:hypothetical protein
MWMGGKTNRIIKFITVLIYVIKTAMNSYLYRQLSHQNVGYLAKVDGQEYPDVNLEGTDKSHENLTSYSPTWLR